MYMYVYIYMHIYICLSTKIATKKIIQITFISHYVTSDLSNLRFALKKKKRQQRFP